MSLIVWVALECPNPLNFPIVAGNPSPLNNIAKAAQEIARLRAPLAQKRDAIGACVRAGAKIPI
jgi:hypothetical protein